MLVQRQFGEKIFDVSDKSKHKKLPVHDFNVPEINFTPRFLESCETKVPVFQIKTKALF